MVGGVNITSEKKPRQLFKERYERVMTTISLKEPDRVPIAPNMMFYPLVQLGISKKDAMYDLEKTAQAFIKVLTPLNFDLMPFLLAIYPGQMLDLLGNTMFKWPGAADEAQRLDDNIPFQFVEGEYMKADEYEEFFADPTGFLLRKIVPRQNTSLQGFSEFPKFHNFTSGLGIMFSLPIFNAMPGTKKIRDSLNKASEYFFKYMSVGTKYEKDLKKLGFPIGMSGLAMAPFDVVSDGLRGMRGSMLDMYRKPEELKKLVAMLVEGQIETAVNAVQMTPKNKIVFMPLHRGADGFMSLRQFEEFYWPTLTKVMEGLIKNGLIPAPFFEGGYNDRLEPLKEFAKKHKGKLIYWFDKTDIIKAKEIFGDYACIRGNIPGSMLIVGNPQQIDDYIKKIIEGCGEGGGLIIDGGNGIPDESKPENVKAMADAVFKHGVYRK